MRSNMVFYNLPEVDKEDSFATVRDVLVNKMEIDTNNEIEIERAHRLGSKHDNFFSFFFFVIHTTYSTN